MKKKVFTLALVLILVFSFIPIVSATGKSNILQTGAVGHDDYLITQEKMVDGVSIIFTTTSRLANVLYSHELVDIGGVPLLITIYDFGWYSVEVGTLMEDIGEGTLAAIPSYREVESPYFSDAIRSFYIQHFDLDYATAEQRMMRNEDMPYLQIDDVDACNLSPLSSQSGSYNRLRLGRIPDTQNYWLDLETRFDWELDANTNWGNPFWSWDRVWFRNYVSHAFFWPRPYSNRERITTEIIVTTHGILPVSFTISKPPSISLSPPSDQRNVIIRETTPPNALYQIVRMHSTLSVYRQSYILRGIDLATLETRVSLGRWTAGGGFKTEVDLVRTAVTATFGLSGPIRSFIPD